MIRIECIRDKALVHAIAEKLREADEIDVPALALEMGHRYERGFKLAFSQANSLLHAEGHGFVPKPGRERGGLYVRASTRQKINRAQRYRSASARKLARQYVSLAAADERQLPEAERPVFRASVEKVGALSAKAIALISRRDPELEPPSFSMQQLPRGRPR